MLTLEIFGHVQGVMFRQTFVRGLIKRGLVGGATNDDTNRDRVVATVIGDKMSIDEIILRLTSGEILNSRGARVEKVRILEDKLDWKNHEVTTLNVENFKWKTGVEFYF